MFSVLPSLPGREFLIPLLVRGLFVWLVLRAVLAFIAMLIEGAPQPIVVPGRAALWLVLIVTAVGILELRRRNETLLLANLGVRRWLLALLCAAPAIVGELAIFWGQPGPA
ncbi:MAG TPA: hypothetical protein VFS94_08430 [Gemmatimonadales bacterium]|nr:hypothetical protein [Gemmatimonadales bacterium]